ncbi:MAG: hypothetical protein JWM11_657 [Planctomycetaceae bacterium]|nr:hypothetical protein [Planctomycetaceae bacterium]
MSFIGKILVVMQLVMSICLMAFAAAVSTYQTNWKTKSESLDNELTKQRGNFAKLEQESKVAADTFNKKLLAQEELAKKATYTATDLQKEVKTLADANNTLKTDVAKKQQLQKDLATDNVFRHDEVKELRAQIKQSNEDRDKEYKAKELLETTIFDLKTDITRLSALTKEQLRLNEQYRRVLASKGLSPEIQDHEKSLAPPPKGLAGKVEEVKKNGNGGGILIQITIGENDGLAKNHMLTVFRSGSPPLYIGKALVVQVGADTAVCRMIEPIRAQIEKGDDVATQLIN